MSILSGATTLGAVIEAANGGGLVSRLSTRRIIWIATGLAVALIPVTGGVSLAVVLIAMLFVWGARRHRRMVRTRTRLWRVLPLVSAAVLIISLPLSWGATVVFAPIGVGVTLAALRRLPTWKDAVVLLGLLGNAFLALGFVGTLAIVVHEALKAIW
jgi:hypothetical protein